MNRGNSISKVTGYGAGRPSFDSRK